MQYSYSIEITLFHLKIENLDPRGIQLSALFMSGVDMALFANDACGQPVPWEHCCPWMYFDGKLFQSKLLKASREKTPLIDLCDGQVSCRNAVWWRWGGTAVHLQTEGNTTHCLISCLSYQIYDPRWQHSVLDWVQPMCELMSVCAELWIHIYIRLSLITITMFYEFASNIELADSESRLIWEVHGEVPLFLQWQHLCQLISI